MIQSWLEHIKAASDENATRLLVNRIDVENEKEKTAFNIQSTLKAVLGEHGRDGHFRCLLNLWCQENGTNKNLEHIQWGNIFIIIRFLSFNIWMFATSKPFTSCQPNFVIIKPLYCPRNNSFRQKHI